MRVPSILENRRIFVGGAILLLSSVAVHATDFRSAQAAADSSIVIPEAPLGPVLNWIEHFDTYTAATELIGQGGWEGWNGDSTVGAMASTTQARSTPNSVDILGDTDLVHQYSGYTSGLWTYTAWQYFPAAGTGKTYFILLNTYPGLAGSPGHWSVQLCFDGVANLVRDDIPGTCTGTTTLALVRDQWVEIRVVIDLDTDTQTVFYNGQQLYTGAWSTHLGPQGSVSIRAVDLFANLATSTFYDDISLSNLPFIDGFNAGDTLAWHETVDD